MNTIDRNSNAAFFFTNRIATNWLKRNSSKILYHRTGQLAGPRFPRCFIENEAIQEATDEGKLAVHYPARFGFRPLCSGESFL